MTDPGYWWATLERRTRAGPAPYHAVTLHQSSMRPSEGNLVRVECNRTGEVSESLELAYPNMPSDDDPGLQVLPNSLERTECSGDWQIVLNELNAVEANND